jgi:hypothetical protein
MIEPRIGKPEYRLWFSGNSFFRRDGFFISHSTQAHRPAVNNVELNAASSALSSGN